jgi:probable HAF family extracellular repeat protein
VNARDEVVGSANGRAFLYTGGALRDLGTLGGNNSVAKGINDRGQIVGFSANAYGQPSPFIYEGAMRELPGGSYSEAIGINNRVQVIGSGEGRYGYLIANGKAIALDTLPSVRSQGWHHLEPKGINDHGWIVGTALNAEGDTRAFLLVPRTP